MRIRFPVYRSVNVPVALSTDDEGVSRIDLTHEYVRAAIDYGLTYRDLKQMARTGMEHGFLPGASLWADAGRFSKRRWSACKSGRSTAEIAATGARISSAGSEKADGAMGAGAAIPRIRSEVPRARASTACCTDDEGRVGGAGLEIGLK